MEQLASGRMATGGRTPWWAWTWPALAWVVLVVTFFAGAPAVIAAAAGAVLIATVFAAVYHAEVIAHRVGEPFGSLVLAVAVTVIEVALIVTLMATGGAKTASLARDTVFAAVMITCNGILGISVLIAALRRRVATFNAEGAATALATIATLATLSLVLPRFTTSEAGPAFSPAQLAFAAIASVILYAAFVLVQTVRHRDQFVPAGDVDDEHDGEPPTDRRAAASL